MYFICLFVMLATLINYAQLESEFDFSSAAPLLRRLTVLILAAMKYQLYSLHTHVHAYAYSCVVYLQ